jgi:hypothetical protein
MASIGREAAEAGSTPTGISFAVSVGGGKESMESKILQIKFHK